MIRASIVAAALTLVAAATPSFAGGHEYYRTLAPYADSQYDNSVNRLVVDYSGRVVFDEKHDDCAPRQKVVEENYYGYYGRPVDRPVEKSGYGYYK